MKPLPRVFSFLVFAVIAGVGLSSAENGSNPLLVDPVFSLDRVRIKGAPPEFDSESLRVPLKNSFLFHSRMHKLARRLENEAGLPKNFILFEALQKQYVNGFRLRGFLDANASVEAVGQPGKRTLLVTLKPGKRFAYRGFDIDPAVPAAFLPRLRMALGLDPEGLEKLRREQALWERYKSQAVLPGAKGSKRWFGVLGLLSPSQDKEEAGDILPFPGADSPETAPFKDNISNPPGFFEDTLLQTITSLQKNAELLHVVPEVPFSLDKSWREDATQLVGEEAARQGFPDVQVTADPVRGKNGIFRVRVGLDGSDTPLRLGKLHLIGVTLHEPEKVKAWIVEKAGLAPGTLLTSEVLAKAKRILMHSFHFYDVGIRPSVLSGTADLLITLRDSPRLPLLGAEVSPEQHILRQAGRFMGKIRSVTFTGEALVGGPDQLLRSTLQVDDQSVRLRLDWPRGDGNASLDMESRDGMMFFLRAPDAPPFQWKEPVQSSLVVSVHHLCSPEQQEDETTQLMGSIRAGMEMSTRNETGSFIRLETVFEPAALILSDKDGGKLRVVSDSPVETVLVRTSPEGASRRIVVRKKDDAVTGIRLEFEEGADENGTSAKYALLLSDTLLPAALAKRAAPAAPLSSRDFWKAVGRRTGELIQFIVESHSHELREHLPVPPNAMPALMEELVVPLLQGFAFAATEEEDEPVAQRSPQGKWYFRASLRSLLRDEPGETNWEEQALSFLEESLGWKKNTWPHSLVAMGFNIYLGRSQNLFKDLNALIRDDSIGPLGNMALAGMCGIVGIAPGQRAFTMKARRSMGWLFVWEDLESLGIAQRLPALFASLPRDAVLREILPEDKRDGFDDLHARIRATTSQTERAKLSRSLAYLLYQAHFRQKLLDALTNSLEGKFQ